MQPRRRCATDLTSTYVERNRNQPTTSIYGPCQAPSTSNQTAAVCDWTRVLEFLEYTHTGYSSTLSTALFALTHPHSMFIGVVQRVGSRCDSICHRPVRWKPRHHRLAVCLRDDCSGPAPTLRCLGSADFAAPVGLSRLVHVVRCQLFDHNICTCAPLKIQGIVLLIVTLVHADTSTSLLTP